MAIKPNIKLLTNRERIELKNRYSFVDCGDNVLVITKGGKLRVPHPKGETIVLNSSVRKVSITPEAVSYWERMRDINLFDLQHTINALYVSYQPINEGNIRRYYNNSIKQILTINKGELYEKG